MTEIYWLGLFRLLCRRLMRVDIVSATMKRDTGSSVFDNDSELTLVDLLRRANESGARVDEERFWSVFEPRIRNLSILRRRSPDRARDEDDIRQTVLPSIVERLRSLTGPTFETDGELLAYVSMAIRHRLADLGVRRRPLEWEPDAEFANSDEHSTSTVERHDEVARLIADARGLRPGPRRIILRRLMGESFTEIAQRLDKKPNTVRTTFRRKMIELGYDPHEYLGRD